MTDTSSNQLSRDQPNRDAAINTLVRCVVAVAPEMEAELGTIDRDDDLFETLDLDSMDHINVMEQLWTETGVEIAEKDYGRLRSLNTLADHLVSQSG